MRIFNDVVFSAGSLGADLASAPIKLDSMYLAAIAATWTGGTAAGTLKIQFSEDDPTFGDGDDVTNWYDAITSGCVVPAAAVTVSGAGSQLWEIGLNGGVPHKWMRLVFTRTSGTGSIDAKLNAKGV